MARNFAGLIVHKAGDTPHYRRDFGGGSKSNRIVLPSQDGCRVKVTEFFPKISKYCDIKYNTDETVYVVYGSVVITAGDSFVRLVSGSCYVASPTAWRWKWSRSSSASSRRPAPTAPCHTTSRSTTSSAATHNQRPGAGQRVRPRLTTSIYFNDRSCLFLF